MPCSKCGGTGHNSRTCKVVVANPIDAFVTPTVQTRSHIAYNTWIGWTKKSEKTTFKSRKAYIGDGEEKVANELNATVLGQNSTYDMNVLINGVMRKCEIKKLDNKTFNTGAEGKEYLRPVRSKLESLLTVLKSLETDDTIGLTDDIKKRVRYFHKIKPDELSVGTFRRLKELCKVLNTLYNDLKRIIPTVTPFIDKNTLLDVSMSANIYVSICELLERHYPANLERYKKEISQIRYIQHPYVIHPESLEDDLKSLLKMFEGLTLIIVDEKKGLKVL